MCSLTTFLDGFFRFDDGFEQPVESAIVDQNIAIGVPQFTNLVPRYFHSDDGFEQLRNCSNPSSE